MLGDFVDVVGYMISLYINLRRCLLLCLAVCLGGWKCVGVSHLRFTPFALASCYAVRINALSIEFKVYIERSNMQVELIQFRKKYHLYSCLLLRSDEFNAARVFTLGKSLHHKPVRYSQRKSFPHVRVR